MSKVDDDSDCPACRGSLVVRVGGPGLHVVPCPDLAGVHERTREEENNEDGER